MGRTGTSVRGDRRVLELPKENRLRTGSTAPPQILPPGDSSPRWSGADVDVEPVRHTWSRRHARSAVAMDLHTSNYGVEDRVGSLQRPPPFPKWSSTTPLNRSSRVVIDRFGRSSGRRDPRQRRHHCATSCQARRLRRARCFTFGHLSATSSRCCPWWRRSKWEHGSQTAVA